MIKIPITDIFVGMNPLLFYSLISIAFLVIIAKAGEYIDFNHKFTIFILLFYEL